MKKYCRIITSFLIILLMAVVPVFTVSAKAKWPEGITVGSSSVCVMDVDTGTILFDKNMDEVHHPASITKIMTAMLAIESCSLDEVVTFSPEAVYGNEGDTSHISRDVDEKMTMEQCLYGMMLASANECAWAIGEHVAGSMPEFTVMMNEKAESLGCTHTHFNNPNGLPDEEHYTTAHDMALIASAAFHDETFRTICGTGTYTIPVTNKHDEPTYLANHHKMLYPYKGVRDYLYDYCKGGKTGYTIAAGNTLVTYAQKDDMTLVCVVMSAETPYHYTDTISLFDYCFENFKTYNISENLLTDSEDVSFERPYFYDMSEKFALIDTDAKVILPADAEFSDAKQKIEYSSGEDKTLASFVFMYAGREVGRADVVPTGADASTDFFEGHVIVSGDEAVNTLTRNTKEQEKTKVVEEEQTAEPDKPADKVDEKWSFRNLFPKQIKISLTPALLIKLIIAVALILILILVGKAIAGKSYVFRRMRAEKKARKRAMKGAIFIDDTEGKHSKKNKKTDLHF